MTLEFAINKQIIFRIDKEKPVADSVNYLKAHFDFSDDWNGEITAIFKAEDKKFSPKEQILNNGECFVPWEVLTGTYFTVSAFCGNLHTANEIRVDLIRSGYIKGETPQPPTPDVYTQIIERLDNLDVGSGSEGVTDYTKLKNIPICLINLAEFKDRRFNFDEQITKPGLYKCVSSDDNEVVDAYIRENDADPIGHLTVMDFFNVLYVNDNTTDGYQATLIFLSSERFIYFLNLSSHSSERSTCFQYPFINDDMLNTDRLSTFSGAYIMEILLDMSQNESENMDSIRQQLMLLIEQEQSRTEQKFKTVNENIQALTDRLDSLTNANEVSY